MRMHTLLIIELQAKVEALQARVDYLDSELTKEKKDNLNALIALLQRVQDLELKQKLGEAS
jgi:hypothetical protein